MDVVDSPAANQGFFGERFFSESVMPSAVMTNFLDKFLNNPDAVEKAIAFLSRYAANREGIDETGEEGKTEEVKKEVDVEFAELTQEILLKERPDLAESFRKEGEKAATAKERERVLGIVKSAHQEFGSGMEEIVEESIEKGRSSLEALALMRKKRLEELEKGAAPAPGPEMEEETPPAQKAAEKKTHLERAKEYQKEHKCSIIEALRATAQEKEKE